MTVKRLKLPHLFTLDSAVVCCFLLSGAAGLIYQILWLRMMDKVVGSAPFAVAAVLSVFMGGLALGSYIAGKYIDGVSSRRKLLSLYGKVELAIGAYGLLLPLLIWPAKPIYVSAYNALFRHFFLYQLFSFSGCAALLIIPTTLMGFTLPLLCRFYVAGLGHLGVRTGRLYGINTFGAVAGALLCGFFLIVRFGVYGSLLTAVGINLLVGVLSIGLAGKHSGSSDSETKAGGNGPKKKVGKNPETSSAAISRADKRTASWALCIFFVSGFCAMAYEVFWTRLLGLIIGPTTYSFTLVVSTFIVGLALGSILFGWLADRVAGHFRLLVLTQICAAGLALAISQFLGNSQFFFSKLIHAFQDDFGELMFIKFVVLFFILIGPTIFLGATFPLVNKIYARSLSALGKSIGNAYAVNTIGAILGSFIAGYILIPFLGKENGLRLVIALQAAIAMGASAAPADKKMHRMRSWAIVLAAIVVAVPALMKFPSWNRNVLSGGWYHRYDELEPYFNKASWIEAAWKGPSILARYKNNKSDLVFYGDGIGGFTTVEEEVDSIGTTHYSLYNSGKADASTHSGDRSTQSLLAHVPLLFHPNSGKVMVLGLASGMTAGEVLLYPVKRMDVLEISDQVVEACKFFNQWNNDCLADPATNMIVQDGRNHLELTRETYDVIISEPSNPWMAGLANLFSLEFFETVRDRLSEDGTFVQWIHSYEMDWNGFAMVGRTFATVFPEGLLVKTSPSDFLLVGFKGRRHLDPETADRNLSYAEKSTNITIRDPRTLFHLIVTEDLKEFFGTGPLHTDNRPRLEFAAPRNLDKYDVSIPDRVAKNGRLSRQTAEILESANTTDALLDFLELSLAQSSPSFDIVDPNNLTAARRERYQDILYEYCSDEFVENYDVFPGEELKSQCAHLQSDKIERHMATGSGREDVDSCNLAVAYRIMGKTGKEIEMLERAILLNPYLYSAYSDLGIALSKQGRFEEATARLKEALRIKPGDEETLNNLGNVLAARGKTAEAVTSYTKALKGTSGDVEVLCNLGNVLAAQGKTADAIEYYSKALQISPDCMAAHRKLGNIYMKQGRFGEAMTHLNELLEMDADNADLCNEIGCVFASQGKIDEAAKYFMEALRMDANHLSANYNFGLLLAEQQQFEAAIKYLRKAVELKPDDPSANNALGVVLGRSGRADEALHHFAESLDLNPNDAKVHDNMGLALLQMGRLAEAADHFARAFEIDNSFEGARRHLEAVQRQLVLP